MWILADDEIDARRLAGLLRLDHLNPVYHGEHGVRTLKELVRSYLTITKDLARVKSRVRAIYRSWAIPCTAKGVYLCAVADTNRFQFARPELEESAESQ